jgi:hypothetical protein
MSILHEHLSNNKVVHIGVDFKWFGEIQEF